MNGEASAPTFALTARISLPIVPYALFATAISEIAPDQAGTVPSPPLHDFVNSDVDIVSDADVEFLSALEGPVAFLHDLPEMFLTLPSDTPNCIIATSKPNSALEMHHFTRFWLARTQPILFPR